MRNKAVQMSLFDIYNGVLESIEEKKPELITLLEEHIDFDRIIPCEFTSAFYGRMGRRHIYHLESIFDSYDNYSHMFSILIHAIYQSVFNISFPLSMTRSGLS